MGPATVYLAGLECGPIKVGLTTGKPRDRLSVARHDMGSSDAVVLASWSHDRAFMVEKLAHLWLENLCIYGEWFAADIWLATNAVEIAIREAGIDRPAGAEFMESRPDRGVPARFNALRSRLIKLRRDKAEEFQKRVRLASEQWMD